MLRSHPFEFAPLSLAIALALSSISGLAGAQAPAAAAVATTSLNLPAQPLGSALNALARQAQLQLLVHPDLLTGKQAPAISGRFTVGQALERLLAGSGLVADIKGSEVIVRRAPPRPAASTPGSEATLPMVTVNAQRSSTLKSASSAGALGSRRVLDTPFSITTVEAEDIEARLVTTLEQALRFDASTQATGNEYGWGSTVAVRGLGLDTSNGYKIDGLPISSWGGALPMEPFERVDLLKGLSGFMHGFGAPGGIANYVLKRPTDATTATVTLGYKSDSLITAAVDLGGRFGPEQRLGYRLNVAHEEGDTYVNQGGLRRKVVSLALDNRLSSDLTATFDVIYAERLSTGNSFWGVGLSAVKAIPTAPDPALATQPEGSYYNAVDRVTTTGLQWRIAPDWSASLSWRNTNRAIDYNNSTLYISNLAGDYSADRSDYRFETKYDVLQAMIQGRARTGGIGHQLTFGASTQELVTWSDTESTYTAVIGTGNIYTDSTLRISGSAAGHSLYRSSVIEQSAVFASDTLEFDERWSLLLGARYNQFTQDGYSEAGLNTAHYERDPITPTVALMYKPSADATAYISAVESLEQGGTAGRTTVNAYEVMGPIKSRQYEVGYKIDRADWSGTLALFRIDRTAEYTNEANYYVQDGITRYQGLEVAGRLRLSAAVTLSGGVMLMDSTYKRNSAGLDGQRTDGTPHTQATLRADWRVGALPGLDLWTGGKYVGSAMMDTSNSYRVDAYTVVDAGANYSTRLAGRDVTFTAAVQNLADRRYWVYNGSDYVATGAARTLSLSARVAF
jgi:iron complex outermembrane recepter protein